MSIWPARLLLGCVVLLCSVNCSLLLKPNEVQCRSDGDCTSRFEGTYCAEDGVCVSDLEFCNSNQSCIERNGSESFICRTSDKRCVNLLTKECPRLLADPGDLRNPSSIVISTVGMPHINAILAAGENGVELARQDFRNSIPAAEVGQGARPLVIVSCDVELFGPEAETSYKIAIDHLIDEVNVPVIIGPLSSFHILYALNKALPQRNPLIITPSSVAGPQFTDIPGRVGLLFRNSFTTKSLLIAQANLIPSTIEPIIRGAGTTRPLKVAVAKGTTSSGTGNTTEFTDALVFNGKSALDNGENFREFTWGDVSLPNLDSRVASVVTDVVAYEPDIVMANGADEIMDFTGQVESALPGRAHFLLNAPAIQKKMSDRVGSDEAFRKRIWLAQGGRSVRDRNLATYLRRHENAFPEDNPGGEPSTSAGSFDATYMAVFAIAGNGNRPLTGENLGEVLLTRLKPPGTPIDMGPTQNLQALGLLSSGQNIDYNGAYSTARFDEKGDIVGDVQFWCVQADTTQSFPFQEMGLYYDATAGRIAGTNGCF